MSVLRSWLLSALVVVGVVGCGGGGGGGGSDAAPPPTNGGGSGSTPGPIITTQPQNQFVTAGQTASFLTTANGGAPISYQWRRNDQNIDGATNPTYETPATTLADNGAQYSVVVTNSAGNAVSSTATLYVSSSNAATGAPQIIQQQLSVGTQEGVAVTFQIIASGTPPLTFVWKKNGQTIPNENSATYVLSNPLLSDSGSEFQVTVTNAMGSTSSANIPLTVVGTPVQISVQPNAQSVFVGGTATFNISAIGAAPITYQWYRNGNIIPGANGATYRLSNVSLVDSGDLFNVVATNPAGYATSQTVALTVNPAPPTQTARMVDISTTKEFVSRGTYDPYSISYSRTSRQVLNTQGAIGISLASYAYPNQRPLNFEASISLAGLNDGSFYSDMSLNTPSLVIANPLEAIINGIKVNKYDLTKGDLFSYLTVLNISIFNAFDSGFREVDIGQWKYISAYQGGYFAGWPTARGAFIAGTPTPSVALSSISSASYSGFIYAGTEVAGQRLLDLGSIGGTANISYDAASKNISITLSDIDDYSGYMSINGSVVSTTSNWPIGSSLGWQPVTCNAQLIPPTNSFSCDINGTLVGKIEGKFFGAAGSEIGATFTLVPAGTDHGIVGALMVKTP